LVEGFLRMALTLALDESQEGPYALEAKLMGAAEVAHEEPEGNTCQVESEDSNDQPQAPAAETTNL